MDASQVSPDLIDGIDTFLTHYASVKLGDQVIVAYTPDSRESAAWVVAGLRMRGINARTVMMRPLIDDEFKDRLEAVLPNSAEVIGRLVIITIERDTMSHFDPLSEVWHRLGSDRCQIIRIISASREFFTEAMRITPSQLSDRNATLLSKLSGVRNMRVRSESGTDLQIAVNSNRYDWISNRGIWRPGGFTILPAGEIATFPAQINGTLVADGAVNCNIISRLDMRLKETPVTVTVKAGVAVDFHCADREISELIDLCFQCAYGQNAGELGFGTNSKIRQFIPHNSHINERRPGVHLGFGQHNQDKSKVSYSADYHLDLITDGAKLQIEGTEEVIDLKEFAPENVQHPSNTRDEDITGDCCGMGYGQLRATCTSPPRSVTGMQIIDNKVQEI